MKSDEIPSLGQVALEVPSLGTVTGLSLNNKTCQYLGIPYGSIPGRFRRSVPSPAPWPDRQWDGTKLGPYCPQPPRDFYPVPSPSRSWLETPGTDELNCLNLNISVPCLPTDVENPLPVMVFIHGGAFTYATASSPMYDGRLLASSSADEFSRPTIIVTVGYRLGVYGFLAGHDLRKYNAINGEDGVGNYGVWDQVLALRWIQKHIAAFGGDPTRVTLFGQSAGGVSTHCHLLRNEPLFSSAILQSGLLRTCGVLSVDQFQTLFEKMLLKLNISLDLSPEERVEKLLTVGTAELTSAMASVFIIAVVTMPLCDDGVLLGGPMPSFSDYSTFSAPSWCPRLILGDAKNECIIWNKSWDNLSSTPMTKDQDLSAPDTALVLRKMTSLLGSQKAQQICNLYGISESMPRETLFWALEKLTTDGIFSLPIYFAELVSSNSIFAYHFDVPSPYKNAWGGLGHHSHDNVLIWGILKHTLPSVQQEVSERMSEAWIKFASGEEPWEVFSRGRKWMVFDGDGATLKGKDENHSRSYETWDKLHDLDLVADVCRLSDELCLRTSELVS